MKVSITHTKNYTGEWVKLPLIIGAIQVVAHDGAIVMWRTMNGNYRVRYGLKVSKFRNNREAAIKELAESLIHYMACEGC